MATTTSYGDWNNRGDKWALTVEQSVIGAFGTEGADGFDFDAIVSDYRDAINAALPNGVTLSGNDFYGPYHQAASDFDGYPVDEDGHLDIKAVIDSVDLWKIIARHDHTA